LQLFDILNESLYVIQANLFPDTESDEIEFKSLPVVFQTSGKHIHRFANTNGGIVVLGVREKTENSIMMD
jgi:predicted HTH transcriptional regulator